MVLKKHFMHRVAQTIYIFNVLSHLNLTLIKYELDRFNTYQPDTFAFHDTFKI